MKLKTMVVYKKKKYGLTILKQIFTDTTIIVVLGMSNRNEITRIVLKKKRKKRNVTAISLL